MSSQALTFASCHSRDHAPQQPAAIRYRLNENELHVWVNDQGSKRVCTELFRSGVVDRSRYIADVAYCRYSLSETVLRGYRIWGPACASLMQRHRWFMTLIATPTKWFIEDSAFHMALRDTPHWRGRLVRRAIFVPACWAIGALSNLLARRRASEALQH
ncbi:hypothetical protein [Burkholderia sp. IDO3]|uniref:hypothetical protein n=1 Tax=Burkholderia sp. IDO3 TaxID=1705310 RepID=UPI001177DE9D|nr:hypothetical protein [Burkholderia sp. IDO3]